MENKYDAKIDQIARLSICANNAEGQKRDMCLELLWEVEKELYRDLPPEQIQIIEGEILYRVYELGSEKEANDAIEEVTRGEEDEILGKSLCEFKFSNSIQKDFPDSVSKFIENWQKDFDIKKKLAPFQLFVVGPYVERNTTLTGDESLNIAVISSQFEGKSNRERLTLLPPITDEIKNLIRFFCYQSIDELNADFDNKEPILRCDKCECGFENQNSIM